MTTENRALTVTPGGDRGIIGPEQAGGLAKPADVVAKAVEQANALMDIVKTKGLFKRIGAKDFLVAEAWQVVAAFNLVSWETEWVRPVTIKEEIVAYEAKVSLVQRGEIVGSAIMSCGLDDDVCKSRTGWDQHKTAQSAAETWAGAKASRMKFAWVAVLAGFAPTPAEEMPKEDRKPETAPRGLCPVHRVPFVHRTGTSKAGVPYDFWACPGKTGGQYCKEKPADSQPARVQGELVDDEPFDEDLTEREQKSEGSPLQRGTPMHQADAVPPAAKAPAPKAPVPQSEAEWRANPAAKGMQRALLDAGIAAGLSRPDIGTAVNAIKGPDGVLRSGPASDLMRQWETEAQAKGQPQ